MPTHAPSDVLARIAELPGVAEAAADALTAVDALLWDRSVRPVATELARRSLLRGGWANAAMDGAEVPFGAVESGTVEDSPMGLRAQRTVAMTAQLPGLVEVYSRSPAQAWARLNTLLVGGLAPADEVGRPRTGEDAEDPLRLPALPPAPESRQRLTALADLVLAPSSAPAVVAAGVVHAELAVLRPFRHASGPVARATIRLSLAARGVDPDLLTVPESGLLAAGRAKYVRALQGYATGGPDGLAQWLRWFSAALRAGAEQAERIVASIGADGPAGRPGRE